MISLPNTTLEILGEVIAVANSASFLFRKLSERPSVQSIAESETPEEIEGSLAEILNAEVLTEQDYTLAYCLMVALALKSPERFIRLRGTVGDSLGKLFWGSHLLKVARPKLSANTEIVVALSPSEESNQPTASTETELIIKF